MIAWNLVMSTGIGLAFAAMPNLIVEAVSPEETGQATGVNTLVRSVGASLGAQVSAAVLAGSVVASGAADRQRLHRRLPGQRRRRARRGDHRVPHPQPPRPHGRRAGAARVHRMTAVAAPHRADAVRNRERVIAAAAEVFREKGDAAVVPEIAARAGVGKGTVYRCFPTKDHLVAAVAIQRVRWFEREARAAADAEDPWSAFTALHGPRRRRPLRGPRDGRLDVAGDRAARAASRRAPTPTTRCAS